MVVSKKHILKNQVFVAKTTNTKRIVVLGGGESGVGSAILAKKKGFDVFLSDYNKLKPVYKKQLQKHEIVFEEGKHTQSKILNANTVIKSPGIPNTVDIIKKIKNKNIPIISEIEFAGRYTKAKTICITGSNGKTTTTLLAYHILKTAGYKVGLGGNVGKSFAYQVATKRFEYYVLELSSFQLDDMFEFKANVSILLNITPDHLDRYEYQFENYIKSKFRITQNQTKTEHFIYCKDDSVISNYLTKHKQSASQVPFSITKPIKGNGAFLKKTTITLTYKNQKPFTMSMYQLTLNGKHNLYNSMAAALASKIVNVKNSVIRESLETFENVEHRLEHVNTVNKVLYINDSKSTNINSAWYALESMNTPTVWIVGGQDKGNNYAELEELVKAKVKAIVCLGVNNKKIIKSFSHVVEYIVETKNMVDAVKQAYKFSKEGDTVLLSPACASFDLFDNYEDRGAQFKKAVRKL